MARNMKKALLLLALSCIVSCRNPRPALEPGEDHLFRAMSIKFSYREPGSRQSGRVIWRFDEKSSKFVFFTPLNQAGLELDVVGEEALLLNFSEKTYWRGDFSQLLDRLWGIGVTLAELKSLLLAGEAPRARLAEKGIVAEVEAGPGSEGPRTVLLRRAGAELALRVVKSEERPGQVVLVDYSGRYRADGLESVLGQ